MADRHRWSRERLTRLLVFALPLAGYLTVAGLLDLRYHSYFGDAQAREANAFYVLFGRNPHLAAVGFVWNPGTSIAEAPLLLLKGLFPALTHEMLAAGIVSSFAMAGTAYQLFRFMQELGVGRLARWAIYVLFIVNPMIISYGGDGMSEALFMLCLVSSTRYLARWMDVRDLRSLVVAGIWMGLGYVVRNEAIAGAGFATVLVGITTYRQERTLPGRLRRTAALTDVVLYAIPSVMAFAGWAAVSWIIVGHPFEQYQSAYGTASQINFLGLNRTGTGPAGHFRYVAYAMWTGAPLVPALLAFAGWKAWRLRAGAFAAVLAGLGGVSAFELAAYSTGQISWAFRYVIYVIPFAAMLAGCLAGTLSERGRGGRNEFPVIWNVVWGRRAVGIRVPVYSCLAVLMLAPSVYTTGHTELASGIDALDQQTFQWIVLPHDPSSRRWVAFRHEWQAVRIVAQTLDKMGLPAGAIMVDTSEPCVPQLILQSDNPSQFFIPNDIDFKAKIGSPYLNGVRYLMVAAPTGYGSVDALNVEYPSLYATGANISTLAQTLTMSNCPTFRLYKLNPEVA